MLDPLYTTHIDCQVYMLATNVNLFVKQLVIAGYHMNVDRIYRGSYMSAPLVSDTQDLT